MKKLILLVPKFWDCAMHHQVQLHDLLHAYVVSFLWNDKYFFPKRCVGCWKINNWQHLWPVVISGKLRANHSADEDDGACASISQIEEKRSVALDDALRPHFRRHRTRDVVRRVHPAHLVVSGFVEFRADVMKDVVQPQILATANSWKICFVRREDFLDAYFGQHVLGDESYFVLELG